MPPETQRIQRFRVAGSGYTLFSYDGKKINFCTEIDDSPPRPVAAPYPVQPLDAPHPIEIAFPVAAGAGTLRLTILEQWDSDVWQQLPGLRNRQINDIVDLLRFSSRRSVTCVKVINPPPPHKKRIVRYHGCVITDVEFGETISIEAMVPGKVVTIMYTHTTRIYR